MSRFVHTADWQLGMTRHFLSSEAQARFTAARIDAIGSIGLLARERGCSFVVVAGDVFEANQVARQVVVRAMEAMREFPEVTFFLLPGNHDPLDASSVYRSTTFERSSPANVVVIDSPEPREVEPGLVVIGAPWETKKPLEDLVTKTIREMPKDDSRVVLVGHGAVDALSPNKHDPGLIGVKDLEASIADGEVDYVALGDRHSTTSVGGSGRIWYSGAPEPTDYTEVDPGNALVVDLSEGPPAVESCRVGTWAFVRTDFEMSGRADCDRVEQYLSGIEDKVRTVVKLSLVGQLSLAEMSHLEAVLEHASDVFAAVERWERRSDLVVLPDDADYENLHLTGFAADAVDDIKAQATGSTGDSLVAQDALGLLYRLAGGAQG